VPKKKQISMGKAERGAERKVDLSQACERSRYTLFLQR
jgi:hypothetical protein